MVTSHTHSHGNVVYRISIPLFILVSVEPGMEEELETIIIRERLDQELEVEIKPELKSMYFAQRKGVFMHAESKYQP